MIDFTTEQMLDNSNLWYYLKDDSENFVWIVDYNRDEDSISSNIIIPSVIIGEDEEELSVLGTYNLFYEDNIITSIEFSEGIHIIGNSTCYKCNNLINITIPDGVTTLESYSFWNCANIEEVILPDSITFIERGSFCGCSELSTINLPNQLSIDLLEPFIFQNNPNLVVTVDYFNNQGIQFLIDSNLSYNIIGGLSYQRKEYLGSQYFLAGVANAEIFKGNDLFATAKTLIDSSITIGVSAEDIRAGQGAKLYGKYFHTSTFDLKMTDAMFRLEYIAANVGSDLELGGDVFIEEELIATSDGKFYLSQIPKPMTEDKEIYIYYKNSVDDYYTILLVEQGEKEITIPGVEEGAKYCIKYLYTNDSARKLVVKANFTPDTLSVYLTANLYSGDSNNPSTGTKVGTVTIKIPRFLLNGSQEINMSMTGAANTPFEGSALATKGTDCDGDGIYAEIIEIITGRTYKSIVDMKIQDSDDILYLKEGDTYPLIVYGRFDDFYFSKLNNSKLFFISEDEDFVQVDENGIITAIWDSYNFITSVRVELRDGNDVICFTKIDVIVVK